MENKILELSPMDIKANELVARIKDLTIAGIEDEVGYQIVKEAYIEARDFINSVSELRLDITRQYDDAKKQLIVREREIIAKVEPVKEQLGSLKKEIDDEKLRLKIVAALPGRKALLEGIELVVSDDELLLMTNEKFEKFFTDKKGEYLTAKEARLKEAEDKLAEEKRQAAEKKRIDDEKAAAVEAERKRASEEKEQALKDAADKAEREKQEIIDAQAKKEKDAEDERIRKENEAAEEKKKREANEKYQDFLKELGYSEETKADFKIFKSEGGEISVYKKVGSIIL